MLVALQTHSQALPLSPSKPDTRIQDPQYTNYICTVSRDRHNSQRYLYDACTAYFFLAPDLAFGFAGSVPCSEGLVRLSIRYPAFSDALGEACRAHHQVAVV